MQVKSLRRSVVSSRLLGIALLLLAQGMAGCGDGSRDGGPVAAHYQHADRDGHDRSAHSAAQWRRRHSGASCTTPR